MVKDKGWGVDEPGKKLQARACTVLIKWPPLQGESRGVERNPGKKGSQEIGKNRLKRQALERHI